jgi:hypothetical protein
MLCYKKRLEIWNPQGTSPIQITNSEGPFHNLQNQESIQAPDWHIRCVLFAYNELKQSQQKKKHEALAIIRC